MPFPSSSGSSDSSGSSGSSGSTDQVLNESIGDFDGTIAGEREVLAESGGGGDRSAGRREQSDADARMGQAPDGMAGLPGSESPSGGSDGSQSSQTGSGPQVGADGNQADGGEGSESSERSGDNNASDRDGANVANIPDDIPIDGSGDDMVAEQIREAAMQEDDPAIRDVLWEEYRKHTGIR